jgi:hypothetical protein
MAGHDDFADLDTLTAGIDKKAAKFTNDIERFLSHHASE